MNLLNIKLLKRILGVPKSTSNNVTILRSDELPLDYHLALVALIWYLKARNNPGTVLHNQYIIEKRDDVRWYKSLFFHPAEEMLTRLNSKVEKDLFSFSDNRGKFWIRKAMCFELSEMWYNDSKSIFTKRLYGRWCCNKLYGLMLTKITTTWYHQLACGRGHLNGIQSSYYPHISPLCRFGCNCDETVDHIFLHCPFVNSERNIIKDLCIKYHLDFTLKYLLIDDTLKLSVEKLLLKFVLVPP